MTAVDPVAAIGFERAATTYAAARPGYPDAALDWLRGPLGIDRHARVLEVGAGTGLFTRLLVRTGAAITAVDPVPAMLAQLHAALPDVATLPAAATAIPLPGGRFDAIVCATAFHWFASAATLAEFRRLLRPGGTLGLIWNVRDERVPWVASLSAITNVHAGEVVRQRDETWRDPFPAPGFSPLVESEMPYAHRGPAEAVVVGRTLSTSFIAALDDRARAEVVAEVRALIARTPALLATEVTFPYRIRAYHCRRVD